MGVGTTFTVSLPKGRDHLAEEEIISEDRDAGRVGRLDKEEGHDGAAPPEPTSPLDTSTPSATILVVEDHEDMRAYLRQHLAPLYRVVEAGDGEEGLARAKAEKPDLILSDVMMPRMDGLRFLKALREDPDLHTTPVILLTARSAEADRIEGLEEHADDYIAKPFSAPELLARVQNLIHSRRALQAQYSRAVVAVLPTDLDLDPADTTFLEKAQAVVEAHLADRHFDVQALAEALFMSRRNFYRRLTALTGMSPAVFIRHIRLQRARQLVEQQALETVSEVAYAVGFSNVSYFSRLYRQTFNTSPADGLMKGVDRHQQ